MALQDERPLLPPGPWDRWPWPKGPWTAPNWLYNSAEVLDLERERLFAPSWNYVAMLTPEFPRPGYVRSFCGDTPVIVTQDEDGTVACLVNSCAHRCVEFVQEAGKGRKLTCPYHGWFYDLQGGLRGVPRGRGERGQGGLPDGFKKSEHGLQRLKVAVRNGIIFASLAPQEDLETWLGPEMIRWLDWILPPGRELRLLGEFEQEVNCHWTLPRENLQDIYHAELLHVLFATFGLARADQPAAVETDDEWRHSVLMHFRSKGWPAPAVEVDSYRGELRLEDERIVTPDPELGDGDPAIVMQVIGWSFVVGRNQAVRHIRNFVPLGPGRCLIKWAFLGFAGDTPETEDQRCLQGSALQGPAGGVTNDDTEILERLQAGLAANPAGHVIFPFGARASGGDTKTTLTEELLRRTLGPEGSYRRQMGL